MTRSIILKFEKFCAFLVVYGFAFWTKKSLQLVLCTKKTTVEVKIIIIIQYSERTKGKLACWTEYQRRSIVCGRHNKWVRPHLLLISKFHFKTSIWWLGSHCICPRCIWVSMCRIHGAGRSGYRTAGSLEYSCNLG